MNLKSFSKEKITSVIEKLVKSNEEALIIRLMKKTLGDGSEKEEKEIKELGSFLKKIKLFKNEINKKN